MNLVLNSVVNECSKLFRHKKYTVFLILEVLICVCIILIQSGLNKALDGEVVLQLTNMSLMVLTFFIRVYIPLVIFMAACDLFSTEMQNNSIKAVLVRPISRLKIFISKILAVTLFAAIYLVCLFVVTNLLEGITNGKIAGFWTGLGAYTLDIIPLLALILMAALINQVTKSSSLAMFLSILIYILICVAGILIPQTSGLLFTGYFQWHNIWIGSTIPFGAMISKIGLLVGYCMVFGCAGFYLFDRRDF